jgi:hypothetical protein
VGRKGREGAEGVDVDYAPAVLLSRIDERDYAIRA